jgi:pimeloyl-ACP methyl ester carboxylesterase
MFSDILLVRGLIREVGHWGEFTPLIQEQFPKSNIVTIDLPGAGIHFKKQSPISIAEMVQSMRAEWLLKRDPKRPCIVVAISLGGMIIAEWIRLYPDDFKSAVLMNTSYSGYSNLFERLQFSAFTFLLKVPLLKGADKEKRILELVANDEKRREKLLPLWASISEEHPVSLPNTLRQLYAGAKFHIGDFIPRIPILIIACPKDRMVSVKCSEVIAKNWNAKIEYHPTAGHDITTDDPLWVAQKISEFVTSLPG